MKKNHLSCCHVSRTKKYTSIYQSGDCFKLCVVTSGEVLWDIGGEHYTVREGDVVLLNDSTVRRFTKINGTKPLSMQIFMLSPDILRNQNFVYLFYNTPTYKVVPIHGKEVKDLLPLLTQIDEELQSRSPYCYDIALSKFNVAIALIARHVNFEYTKPTKNFKTIRQAIAIIDRYYTEQLSLAQLAEHAGMTPSSFSKAFTKCTGVGATQYILRRRIDYAIEQLTHTNKNVLDIALECGFNSGAAFYQSFKKITGNTPKMYRN